MKIASIGIDIGKTAFHVVALDEHGSIVIRRKFSRKALVAYTAKLASSLIGMEACGGAHSEIGRCGLTEVVPGR
jgi:transposase